MNAITVETLYNEKKNELSFEIITGKEYLRSRKIATYDVFRPGLALAGYTGYFLSERVMIVGKTETSYLKTLDAKTKDQRIARVMELGTPCVIITKRLDIDPSFIKEANRQQIPILRTAISTTPFIHHLSAYLEYNLAPTKYIQGTLLDIFGVGVLLIGKPFIGKSECALDLVERGHRLVADDLVKIIRLGDILIGTGAEKSSHLRHHIEIRGLGIIDIFRIFGAKAVRLKKEIELVIELILWDEAKGDYDRIGLATKHKKILKVKIPCITIPLTPGKNISVIAEVSAMHHLLKLRGIDVAQEYDKELKRVMSELEKSTHPLCNGVE